MYERRVTIMMSGSKTVTNRLGEEEGNCTVRSRVRCDKEPQELVSFS